MFKKYLFHFFVSLTTALTIVFSLHVFFDPYATWHKIKNERIEGIGGNLRTIKPLWIKTIRPDVIIMGTSRSEIGINPKHIKVLVPVKDAFNYSIPGQTLIEAERFLEHAFSNSDIKIVLFSLDFFTFSKNWQATGKKDQPDLDKIKYENYFQFIENQIETIKNFTSFNMSVTSLQKVYETALREKNFGCDYRYGDREDIFSVHNSWSSNGQRFKYWPSCNSLTDFQRFKRTLNLYSNQRYFDFQLSKESMDAFERILYMISEKDVKAYFFFTPVHTYLLKQIEEQGLWSEFIDWKSTINNLIQNSASLENSDVVLWDFAYPNDLNQQFFGSNVEKIKDYWDPSHYKDSIGELLITKLLDKCNQGRKCPNDFGRKLGKKINDKIIINDMKKLNNFPILVNK